MSLVILLFIDIIISVYFSAFRIFNVLPAIFLIVLVIMSVNLKLDEALIAGAMMGLLNDAFFGIFFGVNTLIYIWIAYFVNTLTKKYFSNEPFIVLIITLVVITGYELLMFTTVFLFQGKMYFLTYIMKILIPELLYSLILYFPLNFLLSKYRRLLKRMS